MSTPNCRCGGQPQHACTNGEFTISCTRCGITTAGQPALELAAHAWNMVMANQDTSEPANCSACGFSPATVHSYDEGYSIVCYSCDINTGYYSTEEQAITAWNIGDAA